MDLNVNPDKTKVMFVSAVADFKGGAETCLKQFMSNPNITPVLVVPEEGELSRYAEQKSIATEIVSLGCVSEVRRPFKLSSLFDAGVDAIKVGRKINKLAVKLGVDCLHSNGLKTHGILAISRLFSRVPLICHIHDIPYTGKEKLFWRFLGLMCNRLLLVSEHCWPGVLPPNAETIPNAIDVKDDTLNEKIIPSVLSIGFVGRIHPYKGLDQAILWLARAKEAGLEFRFYIRGEAAPSEKEYEKSVRALIAAHNLTEFCFFEGRVQGYDQVYQGLDMILMPSVVDEPFGLVAIESFDQAIPCFAYPSGALPSIIEHEVSGYLCKSPDDFLKSLEHLLKDQESYNFIRLNAHERLKKFYAINTLHQKLGIEYVRVRSDV